MCISDQNRPIQAAAQLPVVKEEVHDEVAVPPTHEGYYMKINGVVYDVREFAKKHPGGSVIKHYLGADATDVFEAFHFRSKKAKKMLRLLPKINTTRSITITSKSAILEGRNSNNKNAALIAEVNHYEGNKGNNEDMLEDYEKWRQSLIDRGFFEPSMSHVVYRIGELVFLYVLSMVCFALNNYFFGISFLGLCGGRAGWLMHEGGHGSLTGNLKTDKRIQTFWYGFMDGLSGSQWNSMHNRHHASTQKIKHDSDLDTMPLVAFHKKALENSSASPDLISPSWIGLQHLCFFVVTSSVVLSFWSLVLHPMNVLRKKRVDEGFWIVFGHFFHGILIQHLTGTSFMCSYCLSWLARFWSAIYIFGHFSLSHTHLDTIEEDEHATWVDQAIEHTVDIETQNPVVNWLMGYLNCQVIHHLFPQMPQFRHPEVSRELVGFAEKWGRPYRNISYLEAWKRTYDNLKEVGEHYANKKTQ